MTTSPLDDRRHDDRALDRVLEEAHRPADDFPGGDPT